MKYPKMGTCRIRDHLCTIVVFFIVLLSFVCGVTMIWNSSCTLIWFSSNEPGKIICGTEGSAATPSQEKYTEEPVIGHGQNKRGDAEPVTMETPKQAKYSVQTVIRHGQATGDMDADTVAVQTVINKGKIKDSELTVIDRVDGITMASPTDRVSQENVDNKDEGLQNIFLALSGLMMILFSLLSCSCLIRFSSKEYASHQRSGQAFKPDAHVEVITTHRLLRDVTDQSPDYAVKSLLEKRWQYEDRKGRDTKGLQHKGIKVRTIHRVVNEKLRKQYDKAADATLISPYPKELIETPICTTGLKVKHAIDRGGNRRSISSNIGRSSQQGDSESDLPSKLTKRNEVKETQIDMDEEESLLPASFLESLNPGEVYLLHGTKLENIPSILETGFDLDRARTGLYGKAIYLAESSEKVDQYTDYASNRRDTDLAMLVVRVKLGHILYHPKEKKVNMPYKGFLSSRKPKYETVVAGHGKRFREFLVFNQKLIYPEFVVTYDRVH